MAQQLTPTITIRPAYADDATALARLAALDSAERAPEFPVLLAEVDGGVRAAISLSDGSAIADPFVRTADVVELLRLHAAATAARNRRARGGKRRDRQVLRPLRLA